MNVSDRAFRNVRLGNLDGGTVHHTQFVITEGLGD